MHFYRTKIFWGIFTIFVLVFLFVPRPADAIAWVPLILIGVLAYELFPDVLERIAGTAGQYFFDALVIFFNTIFATIAGVLQGIYIGMGEILISITQYFISIPVSPANSLTPPFVIQAFDFSRTFVNGFFLLILAFIGLATILRLQEYQLQRTLPKLVLIALLVNFSGVFVGVIVDIANLFTNYFLEAVGKTGALYSSNPWAAFQPDPARLGQNIARIVFYLVGVLIYFVIMFVFGFRVLVLWVLTILAPIAFAAFILPATRKWWNQWLSSLIQWAFIGVPISFFLVLAGHAISMKLPQTTSTIGVEIYNVFAPASALLLLFVGVGISLSLAPAWGKRLALLGAGVGVGAGLGAGYLAWRKMGRQSGQFFENMRKRGQGLEVKAEERTRIEKIIAGGGKMLSENRVGRAAGTFARFGARSVGRIPGTKIAAKGAARVTGTAARFGARSVGRVGETISEELNTQLRLYDEKRLASKRKRVAGLGEKNLINIMSEEFLKGPAADMATVAAAYSELVQKGDPAILRAAQGKNGKLSWDNVKKLYRFAKEMPDPSFKREMEIANIANWKEIGVSEEDYVKAMKRISIPHITQEILDEENFDATTPEGRDFIKKLGEMNAQTLVPTMFRKLRSPVKKRAFMEYLESLPDEWYQEHGRKDILLWSASNTADEVTPIHGHTRETIRQMADRELSGSDQQLKQRMGEMQAERQRLNALPTRTPAQSRRIPDLQRKENLIQEELTLRNKPDDILRNEIDQETQTIDAIDAMPNPTVPQYAVKAAAVRKRSPLQRELTRRKRMQEEKPAPPIDQIPETESIGKRLADLDAKEQTLSRNIANLKPIQVEERAKRLAELAGVDIERRGLEGKLKKLEPEIQIEEAAVRHVESQINAVQFDIQSIDEKISLQQQLGATQAMLAKDTQDLMDRKRELRKLEGEREKATRDLNNAKVVARVTHPEMEPAERVATLREHERRYRHEVRRRRVAHDSLEHIQEAEKLLETTKKEREIAEHDLATILSPSNAEAEVAKYEDEIVRALRKKRREEEKRKEG